MSKKMYDVHIKGTIQWKGPMVIDRWIRMDEMQLRMFRVSDRQSMESWVKSNYPEATLPSNNFRIVDKKVVD